MKMVKDKFYREMTDKQLQATFLEIQKNIKFDPTSEGMKRELEILKDVAKERGVLLDNSTSMSLGAIQGYLEFAVKDLDDSNGHGGKREGAGRPSLGTTKKVSITLPDEVWQQIEETKGERSMSAFLRDIILNGI